MRPDDDRGTYFCRSLRGTSAIIPNSPRELFTFVFGTVYGPYLSVTALAPGTEERAFTSSLCGAEPPYPGASCTQPREDTRNGTAYGCWLIDCSPSFRLLSLWWRPGHLQASPTHILTVFSMPPREVALRSMLYLLSLRQSTTTKCHCCFSRSVPSDPGRHSGPGL
jgi:hypothetical protein